MRIVDAAGATFDGTYVLAANGEPGNHAIVLIGGTRFTLTVTRSASGGGTHAPLNGIQIVRGGDRLFANGFDPTLVARFTAAQAREDFLARFAQDRIAIEALDDLGDDALGPLVAPRFSGDEITSRPRGRPAPSHTTRAHPARPRSRSSTVLRSCP